MIFSIEIMSFFIKILVFSIEIMSFFIKIFSFSIEILVFSIEKRTVFSVFGFTFSRFCPKKYVQTDGLMVPQLA